MGIEVTEIKVIHKARFEDEKDPAVEKILQQFNYYILLKFIEWRVRSL